MHEQTTSAESRGKRCLRYAHQAICGTFLAGALYFGSLAGLHAYADATTQPIRGKQHLSRIVDEEYKKLDLESKAIRIYFSDDPDDGAYSLKVSDDRYIIVLSPENQTVTSLRHELYHIADGHCDDGWVKSSGYKGVAKDIGFFFAYTFYYEPQAVIYETTGLQL